MSEITTNEIVPAVKATQVHKAFGNLHVLKGIDMTVMPGTVTVILGPSGSGKSTFLRLINQLETLTGGEIDVDGEMIGYKYVDKGGERAMSEQAGGSQLRGDFHQRPGDHRPPPEPQQDAREHRHGVSGVQPVPAHDGS